MSEPVPSTPTPSPDRAAMVAEYRAAMLDPDYLNARAADGTWSGHRRAVHRVNTLAARLYGTAPVPQPGVEAPPPPAPPRTKEQAVAVARLAMDADRVARSWVADPNHPVMQRHAPDHGKKVLEYNRLVTASLHTNAAPGREIADAIFRDARSRTQPK